MTDEQRTYDLKRPAHLVAEQVIRDIEALQMVKYGPQHSAPIHRLVEQYQELLFQRDQKIAELMARLEPPAPIPYPIGTPCMWSKYEAVVTDVHGDEDEREIKWFDHGEGEYRWLDVPVSSLAPRLP